jgi:competence protein ComEC
VTIVAIYFAKTVYSAIWVLNHCVLFFDSIPFSLWKNISVSVADTFLLYLIVLACMYSFLKKNKLALKFALAFSILFISFKTFKKWELNHQKKIVVYNIPMHKAIEFIEGNNFYFSGDKEVVNDKLLNKYNLMPVHTAFELKENPDSLNGLFIKNNFFQFYNKRIVMIDSAINYSSMENKMKASYIIISKNPRIKIVDVAQNFDCNNFIFDASNPPWKIEQWKKECEELHLHSYSVPEQGAFVINL